MQRINLIPNASVIYAERVSKKLKKARVFHAVMIAQKTL